MHSLSGLFYLLTLIVSITIQSIAASYLTKFISNYISTLSEICKLLEVAIIRAALAALSVQHAPFLDLVANTGYKYVGLCLNMLLGLCFGRSVYFAALLWTGSMGVFFMLKTLSNNYANGPNVTQNALRMPILWSVAVLQFVTIWWLGYGGDLKVAEASVGSAAASVASSSFAAAAASADTIDPNEI